MSAGLWGGIIGMALGLMGGIVGTYYSIKNTHGPRERRLMVKAAVVTWLAGGLFLFLLFVLPGPYKWLLWVPYGILLPVGIITVNKRQAKIRSEESKDYS
jgi:phosphotransferase system  glucose/maltose/N-acetylglucosamine-specific IIC component